MSDARHDHVVTLNYDKDPHGGNRFKLTPDPKVVFVKKGDTLSFRLGRGPERGKVKVTFKPADHGRFSAPVFHSGDDHLRVNGDVVRTTYQCALLVDGNVLDDGTDTPGGEIEPASGNFIPPPPV